MGIRKTTLKIKEDWLVIAVFSFYISNEQKENMSHNV